MTPKVMAKPTEAELKAEKPTEQKGPLEMAADLTPKLTPEELMKNPAIVEITKIQGIGPIVAQRLYDAGYDLDAIGTGRPDEIAACMKVGYSIAKGWVMAAQDLMLGDMKLMKMGELDALKKSKVFQFKTGSLLINGMLGGGVSTWAITGLSGPLATGKTMVCEDVIVDALTMNGKNFTCPKCYVHLRDGEKCPSCGVSAKPIQAVFIETEPDTLHLDRLIQIARERNVKCDWNNLYVCPAHQIPTMKAQFLQYKLIQKELEKGANIHLICVDSFNSKLRAGWSRSEMLPIRTREIAEHFNLIEHMACKYNIAWLLTCQVITAPRPELQHSAEAKYGSKFYPIGGDLLLHSVNQWLAFTQTSGDGYEATLFDSSYLPKKTVNFRLTSSGLKDGVA